MKQRSEMITVILFLVVLFSFALLFWVTPDRSFSEEENRSLRTLPTLRASALFSGKYAEEINDYFADQFPLRDFLVGCKASTELTLGKGENNGILRGNNGYLARRLFDMCRADGTKIGLCDLPDPDTMRAAAEGISRVNASLNLPFTVMLTGRNLDVVSEQFDYPTAIGDSVRQELYDSLSGEVEAIDTVPILRDALAEGKEVYYRTDHHWTTEGAYLAYAELLRTWGMEDEILPPESFLQRTVSEAFYGTLWSAGGMKTVDPDRMEIWLRGNESAFTVTADGRKTNGLYNYAYLSKKDKYSLFLDGVHDTITVTGNGMGKRPRLVLFKDSFANSLAPFLAQHFDLVLLNLSSVKTDFSDFSAYARQYQADRVLLIYTIENAMTATRLGELH